MLGRKVGTSLLRLPIAARLPIRTTAFQHDLTSRALIGCLQRYYATPGRPRSTVGEPSRPVKRAAKRQAKSTVETTAADKQVKAKKAKATEKAKKPKTAAAKKPKSVRKKAEPTEEQKAAKAQRVARANLADLKKAALNPPPRRNGSAYNVYFKEKLKGVDVKGAEGADSREKFLNVTKPVIAAWKNVSPAELEVSRCQGRTIGTPERC